MGEKQKKSLLKQYLAPTGIGVIIGALTSLLATVPNVIDLKDKIQEQTSTIDKNDLILRMIEEDTKAYSGVLNSLKDILEDDQYYGIFPEDAKVVFEHNENGGTDEWYSVQLKKTVDGAYFIWEEGGYDSPTFGAFTGNWFTRKDAIEWAYDNMSVNELKESFTREEIEFYLQDSNIDF